MKKQFLSALLATGMLVGLSSCSTRIASFSVASTRNFDFTASGSYHVDTERTVSNMDGEYTFLFLFDFSEANMKEAMEGAIRKSGPGCMGLADAVVRRGHIFTGICNVFWYSVEGNPIIRH